MDTPQRILEKVKNYTEYTAKNLSEIVKIPSLSGEEEEVIKKLKKLCEEAGFDEVKLDGLGNLIGRVGNGPKKLAIDAHIDTVDTGDLSQWKRKPYSGDIADGMVYGRGTVDQKGGAASMITAGRILKELKYSGEYSVYFTFTIMEEDCDGMCWKYLIEKEKFIPDCVVITEPTNLGLYRGHRGRMEIEIYFHGVSCHGSAPERGDNAIYKVAEATLKVKELHEKLKSDPFLGKGSVAPTLITSWSPSLCAISDKARVHLDRRLTWGETLESAVSEIKKLVAKGTEVEVPQYGRKSFKGTEYAQEMYFPTWKLEENHPLVQAGAKAYTNLFNDKPRIDKWTFSTNGVAICGRHNIPCIGFGPGNEVQAHAPNECTPIEHLDKAAAFYAMMPYILNSSK